MHTDTSLPCVPELGVDLPVGQAEQPSAVGAVVELLYVPTGHGKQESYPIPEYLPATQSEHVTVPVALYMIIHTESRYTQTYNRVSRHFRERWIQSYSIHISGIAQVG